MRELMIMRPSKHMRFLISELSKHFSIENYDLKMTSF